MKRVLTALVLIAVVLAAIFAGRWWALLGAISVVALLTFVEYSQMLQIALPRRALGAIVGVTLLVVPLDRAFLLIMLFAVLALALPMGVVDLRKGFNHAAALFLGVLYVFGAMKTMYVLGLRNPWWLLFALMINWIGDSGAYYVGRQFGRHKMAPRISPGKSWEGAIASVVCSTVFFVALGPRVLHISALDAATLALLGNVAGQFGDLAESALKRAVGVKDSGTLLPGHGGMWDRVDSALFTVPVVYALTIWMRV